MAEESSQRQGFLLLADISGYTSFLATSELDHAHEIVSETLERITESLRPVFQIAKLEGDAVFAFAPAASVVRPEQTLETIEATYVAFRNRLQAVNRRTTCSCKACRSVPVLDLKFILHFGIYVRRLIAGSPDLVGTDVNIVHRLLKNNVPRATGWNAYVLLTEQARSAVGIDAGHLHRHEERYEHLDPLVIYAFDLHRRYEDISSERRILKKLGRPDFSCAIDVRAPLPVVWEWLNDPNKRELTDGVRVKVKERVDGRIKEGTTFHCAHGDNVAVEEVVEWKPYTSFALEHAERYATLLLVYDLLPSEHSVRVLFRARMFPRVSLLNPFTGFLMRWGAKKLGLEAQLERFRSMAEEEWNKRSAQEEQQ